MINDWHPTIKGCHQSAIELALPRFQSYELRGLLSSSIRFIFLECAKLVQVQLELNRSEVVTIENHSPTIIGLDRTV